MTAWVDFPRFPMLPGQGFARRSREWSTQSYTSASGRETRVSRYRHPLLKFEIPFNVLSSTDDHPGATPRSLQILEGLFDACAGSAGCFIFEDMADREAFGQPLGAGDGATRAFRFMRQYGSNAQTFGGNAVDPVDVVLQIDAVYFDGVEQDGALYDLVSPSSLVFIAAPPPGVQISADFQFGYLCRFSDDHADFDPIVHGLWSGKIKIQQVRL